MAQDIDKPIPRKTYFRIGEVAKYVGVEPHVIRYWETEFNQLVPYKGKGGQRMFRREEVLLLRRIRNLLHVQGYTIDGARKVLEEGTDQVSVLDQVVARLKGVQQKLVKYK